MTQGKSTNSIFTRSWYLENICFPSVIATARGRSAGSELVVCFIFCFIWTVQCSLNLCVEKLQVLISHTPPEGWVRAKKFCITFETNFSRYLPRGTIIDGSWKCRMGAFCTIAKISGEMPKKALKTGQNGVKNFLGPHTYWIITFLAFFYFQFFLILVLYRSSILWKLVLKTGSYKYQNEKYWK